MIRAYDDYPDIDISEIFTLNSQQPQACDFRQNRLLAALPASQVAGLALSLELVDLPFGLEVCASESVIAHVYFPTTAIVSLQYATQDYGHTEVAVVGNDGLVGVSLLLGGRTTSGRAVVQSPGKGYRLRARAVTDEFNRGGAVLRMVCGYTQALMVQVAQTAVCNRHHTIEQKLCRRLLVALDRFTSDRLMMTHEQLAQLLGVRREGISTAAHKLQQAGVIVYNRGHISVLDRPRLEQNACECYAVVTAEYERLLPTDRATTHQRDLAPARTPWSRWLESDDRNHGFHDA